MNLTTSHGVSEAMTRIPDFTVGALVTREGFLVRGDVVRSVLYVEEKLGKRGERRPEQRCISNPRTRDSCVHMA